MAEPRNDLGENDVSFTDTISNVAETVAGSISQALRIENSNQRFYACNHFGQHFEHLIGWFDGTWARARRIKPSAHRPWPPDSGEGDRCASAS